MSLNAKIANMVKKPFIEGTLVDLRPFMLKDVTQNYVDWFNDAEVCQHNSHHVYPYNRVIAEQYIKDVNRQKQTLVLAIITKEGTHIGNISLLHINYINHSAELTILIGDKHYWGKGIAKESVRLLLTHAFDTLNLHRVYCGTTVHNIAMQKVAVGLGMLEEGRRRDSVFRNGLYVDVIEYGLLKGEWHRAHGDRK